MSNDTSLSCDGSFIYLFFFFLEITGHMIHTTSHTAWGRDVWDASMKKNIAQKQRNATAGEETVQSLS